MTKGLIGISIFSLLLAFFVPILLSQETKKPLSFQDIEDWLKDKLSAARLTTLIEERGVDFEATEDITAKIRKAGADNKVIEAVKKAGLDFAKKKKRVGDDGAEMALIPTGEFLMGSSGASLVSVIEQCEELEKRQKQGVKCRDPYNDEQPQHRMFLDAFFIDKYEVTNALFERFVRATGHKTDAEKGGSGWNFQQKDGKWQWVETKGTSWRNPTGPESETKSDHPVVQVSWNNAEAYCKWAGKRLPTEAEWEKAARGTDGRQYPWGDNWDNSKANGNMSVRTTTAVGSYPQGVSPYGVHDMAGNMWEWVTDWYDQTYYQRSPNRNPKGPDSGQYRVLRGGSWLLYPGDLRASGRGRGVPTSRLGSYGFRCAQ